MEKYDDLYDRFPESVRRTAVCQTHYRQGRKRLEEARWSPAAIDSFARAASHTPKDEQRYVRDAVASLFGRPGLRVVDALT